MALTSFNFIIFVIAVVAVYYIVPKKFQWGILLLASYGFYLASGTAHLLYIVGTTLFTYGSGLLMQRIRDDGQEKIKALGSDITKEEKKEMKKDISKKVHRVQVLTVLFNLGVLIYVKCINTFLGGIGNIFSMFEYDVAMPMINVIVPLGLSYYTFNSIGYLIDVGRGKHAAERHLGKFALFVSFFPSIVQGPLFRFNDVGLQLQKTHRFEYNNVKFGAQLVLWGFFKKLVIADRVALVAKTVFAPGFQYENGSQIFFGVLAYSFQIYCDFSGGTDITRGVAQMMGIDLPQNFARPFFATSMGDFWRRWHMSLGAWMREFVFYPIMLSKKVTDVSKIFRKKWGAYAAKMVPSVAAPMVVFFLIGIWHGVTWQYVTNGLYNAILISASVALTPFYKWLADKLHVNTEAFSFRLFQMLRTFTLLCISRIIVKAPSLSEGFKMVKTMFTSIDLDFITGKSGEIFTYGLNEKEMQLVVVCILVLLVIGILQESGMKIRETLAKQNIIFRWGMMLLLIFAITMFGIYGPDYNAGDFIYGAF